MQQLLSQLAALQADAEFELEKSALCKQQEEELAAVEKELQELELSGQQKQQVKEFAGTAGDMALESDQSKANAESKASGGAERKFSFGAGSTEEQGALQKCALEPAQTLDIPDLYVATEELDGAERGQTSPTPQDQEGAEESGLPRIRRQLDGEELKAELEKEREHFIQQHQERVRQAGGMMEGEKKLQEERTEQLLLQRRQRLLEKKARLEAERQKELQRLEENKQLKIEKLTQQLQQDLVDFSIEFEVEAHELDKLARQLWADSQQEYQKQLRDLGKKHAQAMEETYEQFINDWAARHDGDPNASLKYITSSCFVHACA